MGNPVHTIDQPHSKQPSAMSNGGRREDRCLPVALSEHCNSQLEFDRVELYKGRAAGSKVSTCQTTLNRVERSFVSFFIYD